VFTRGIAATREFASFSDADKLIYFGKPRSRCE
jgi:hypothetical protein